MPQNNRSRYWNNFNSFREARGSVTMS